MRQRRQTHTATLLGVSLGLILILPVVSDAALHVYESFDYAVSNDLSVVGTGGTGFAAGWQYNWIAKGYIFPANSDHVEAPAWDGAVSNIPTAPAQVKYCGRKPGISTEHLQIRRQLSSDAGTLAGADNVLWLSAVFHWPNRTGGSGLWIGLGNGYVTDRGKTITAGSGQDFMGSSDPTPSSRTLVASIETNNASAVYDEFPTASLPPSDEACIVVLKYTFGASSDTVEGVVFSETNVLTEAAFNSHPDKVTATHNPGIDESTFNILSHCQEYRQNAVDEIRIGDTFDDVIAANLAGQADASKSSVVAVPGSVPADGSTISTVTVTVLDGFSTPQSGDSVILLGSTGSATITTNSGTTDINGQAVFTVASSTVETEVFTASNTTDSVKVWQSASVNFLGGTDAGNSTVTGTWDLAVADGVSTSSVIITLKDAAGNPVGGNNVTLSGSTGNATISPGGAQVSDSNGQVSFTVVSSTAEAEVFTATDTSDSVVITETFSVTFAAEDSTGLLVYEPFDYAVGALAGQNGGTGFASAWTTASCGHIGWVWDPNNGSVLDQGDMDWDGVMANIPVSTSLGENRFTGGAVGVSEAKRDVYRELSSSAGEMAGADGVLWMSAVLYWANNTGVGVGLGLGDTVMRDRGGRVNFHSSDVGARTALIGSVVSFYGGGGDRKLNAVVATNTVNTSVDNVGNYVAAQGTTFAEDDYVLVFKFRFSGVQDEVETYAFPESVALSEATFAANKITATFPGGFDQDACNLLTWSSARGSTCLDEIRIGNTFDDIAGVPPPAGTMFLFQ